MMKRVCSILLAAAMVFTMSGVEAYATQTSTTTTTTTTTTAPKFSYTPTYTSLKYGSVNGVSTATILKQAQKIIQNNEGGYSSVNPNDNGALSVGKMQWHAYRAADLIRHIISLDNQNAYELLGKELYEEFTKSYATTSAYQAAWADRILNTTEAAAIRRLLATEASTVAQDKLEQSDLSAYINHGISLGVSNQAALIYFADMENQWGSKGVEYNLRYAARIAGSNNVTLNDLHIGCLCYNNKYDARRWTTYRYIAELGLSCCRSGDYRILYRYSSGDVTGIKWLQKSLNAFFGTKITVSGIYDTATKEAVSKYQTAAGISVDGLAGQTTVASLIRSMYKAWAVGSSTGISAYNGTVIVAPVVTLKTATISVAKTSYTVNSNAAAFALGATSNHSQTPLIYNSSNTAVAKVSSAGKVTIVGAGTATITISQAESNDYAATSKKITINSISANPAAYATPTTVLGANRSMTATSIKWFQACMVQLGYYTDLIDGVWDPALTTAAKEFQAAAGLTPDGLIGPSSRTVLLKLVTVKTKVMSVTVTVGTGNCVVKWAKLADADGYYVYRKASGATGWTKLKVITSNATVSYTDATVKAGTSYYYTVRAYAKKGNIAVASGYKASSLVTAKGTASTTTITTTYTVPTVTLGEGRTMTKANVQWFQNAMKQLGYYTGTIDGTWTSALTTAAKKFQTAAGLTADGLIGPASRTVIVNLLKVKDKNMTVTVSAGSNQATVKWTSLTEASGYYVYRKAVGATAWTKLATVGASTTSYTDTKASGGSAYYYCVRAYATKGTITVASKFTASSKVTIAGISTNPSSYTVPTTTLSAGRTMTKSNIQWLQAALYQLGYYKESIDGVWDSGLTTAVKTFQTAAKLESDGIVGSGTRGEIQKLLGVKDTTMSCTVAGGTGKITVSWTKINNATAYHVYRKSSGGSWSRIKTVSATATATYADTAATAGTTYYYCVRAERTTGSVVVKSAYKASAAVKRTS